MPEDLMTQFMQMMRMMEFLRQHRQQRQRDQAGLGRLAMTPGLRERIESAPPDMREALMADILKAENVPEGQRSAATEYLRQPSAKYQFETDKFLAEAERFKGELDSVRRMPSRLRTMLRGAGQSQEEIDSMMIPFEEETHGRVQNMLGIVSRLGQAAFRAHPDDPRLGQIMKDLEATAALGMGAGEGGGGGSQAGPAETRPPGWQGDRRRLDELEGLLTSGGGVP